MEEFERIDKKKFLNTYWAGKENLVIRLWIYAQKGLQEINEFKYFILAFASGVALLYTRISLNWVVIIGLIGVPIGLTMLIFLGRWQLQKAAKVEQYVTTEYGNVLKWSDYNVKVETFKKLEEILNELKKINNK